MGATGDEDDDWFFTFFQPYRYVINRMPVYPSIGNHDGDETEVNDDRDQIMDNFYLAERLLGEEAAGRASVGPGLYYRFRFGSRHRARVPRLLAALPALRRALLPAPEPRAVPGGRVSRAGRAGAPALADTVRAPPAVLRGAAVRKLEVQPRAPRAPVPARGGAARPQRHEHNFQHSRADGIDYFVTGGGGKVRSGRPRQASTEAHTVKLGGGRALPARAHAAVARRSAHRRDGTGCRGGEPGRSHRSRNDGDQSIELTPG